LKRKTVAYLPDVNVLLALAFDAHQHHPLAMEWISKADDCRVCRITQSGFLRLATNPAVFGDETLNLSQAWAVYDTLMEDERFTFTAEPLGFEHLWRRMTNVTTYSPRIWMDRYLAAFAMADSLTLATLDRTFAALPELSVHVLTPSPE
jgi:uncharacterized protein